MLPILPFVLHVLGLPLAFILSQDQTLHSINLHKLQASQPSTHVLVVQHLLQVSASRKLCHLILDLVSILVLSAFHIAASCQPFKELTRGTPLSMYHGSAIISIHSMNVFSFPAARAAEVN